MSKYMGRGKDVEAGCSGGMLELSNKVDMEFHSTVYKVYVGIRVCNSIKS